MIYLDNAATSYPKPQAVYDTISGFLNTAGGNPGRTGHRLCDGGVPRERRGISPRSWESLRRGVSRRPVVVDHVRVKHRTARRQGQHERAKRS